MHTFSPYKQNAHATKRRASVTTDINFTSASVSSDLKALYKSVIIIIIIIIIITLLPHPETVLFFVKVKVKVRTLAIVPLT